MPLSLLNHSALALFAQRTRIPTSARSIGFCAIWVCISSSSSLWFIIHSSSLGIPAPLRVLGWKWCKSESEESTLFFKKSKKNVENSRRGRDNPPCIYAANTNKQTTSKHKHEQTTTRSESSCIRVHVPFTATLKPQEEGQARFLTQRRT